MYTDAYIYRASPSRRRRPGRRTRLRLAGAGLVALGVGHGGLLAGTRGSVFLGWLRRGLVNAVPLAVGEQPQPQARLEDRLHYWAGVGSFAAPTTMLGLLTWRAADRGEDLPAWLGPALIGWSGLAGTIMVRAPWPLAVVAGTLITSAAGQESQIGARPPMRRVGRATSSRAGSDVPSEPGSGRRP